MHVHPASGQRDYRWQTDPGIAPNIAAWRTEPARPARVVPFPTDVHGALVDALRAAGAEDVVRTRAVPLVPGLRWVTARKPT